jgi:hypothetical protein
MPTGPQRQSPYRAQTVTALQQKLRCNRQCLHGLGRPACSQHTSNTCSRHSCTMRLLFASQSPHIMMVYPGRRIIHVIHRERVSSFLCHAAGPCGAIGNILLTPMCLIETAQPEKCLCGGRGIPLVFFIVSSKPTRKPA